MPVEHQPPDVLAMVIAKAVHRDVATGRCFIQETYHLLGAQPFPLTQPSLVVYVALTEGYGTTRLKLRLVDVDEVSPPLFELEAVVNFADRECGPIVKPSIGDWPRWILPIDRKRFMKSYRREFPCRRRSRPASCYRAPRFTC